MEPRGLAEIEKLLAAARNGERTAAERLVGLQEARIRAIVERRLGEALAGKVPVDDVVQESLLRALAGIERFDGNPRQFVRWLATIAERVILESARRAKRSQVIALDFDVAGSADSPGTAMRRRERHDRLRRALDSLSPDYREVLTLVRLQGVPGQEVARRMGRTPAAVSHLIVRALRKLREAFGDTESLRLTEPAPREGETRPDGA